MLPKLSLIFAVVAASSAWGQAVISAHSGVINYSEGQVLLEGKAIRLEPAKVLEMKTDQTLAAEDGRSEVLLTPGAFLRLAENSSFKMISNKLTETQVEILS